ncbi:L-Ala-D/L-Glu epimerase [Pseudothermotoga thermarum]|uniref:Dipeptide epimerase n=1 Tax=Pseudothermotoga thermarum DSM 5069 TaxID=688269 RepID=F7YYG0_9THEM|nr:L-Ala-D/L-Glu epimerase [Pseudothermotoga thermarum]AEH50984.1 Mandelate racemase/muconate lactonizing protein [Pseudothermotoga thermarum DSM 5069]
MKIKSVEFKRVFYRYKEPFTISLGTHETQENVEVCITLEDGTRGYGEASALFVISGETPQMLEKMEKTVQEMIAGMSVERYELIFEQTQKLKATPAIKAAVECAVIDAFCKRHGLRQYEFFGGAKNKIETDITIGITTLERTVEKAKKYYSEGFRILKIKVGKNLKEDVEKILKVNEIGKDLSFIVDANQGYSPKEAVELAQILYREKINVVVFEQPVKKDDILGLKYVRWNSPYPVAADESVFTMYDALRLIKEEAIDMINIKLMKSGISDALAIVKLAKAAGIQLMIGCMGESSLGISASIHFAAGTGAFAYHDLDSHLSLVEETFRGDFKQQGPLITLEET